MEKPANCKKLTTPFKGKRYASHYLLFKENELSGEVLEIIRRDQNKLCTVPPSILSSYPEFTKGFARCVVELTPENDLIRLFPFTEEIESTLWYPGILQLATLLEKEG